MKASEKENALNALYERINQSMDYLAKTDYVVIRSFETGVQVPEEYAIKRAAARTSINEAQAEIERIEAIEPEEEN